MKSPAVGTLAREKTRRPTHPMRTTTAGSCGAQLYRTSSATTGRDGEGTRRNRGERHSKRAQGEERGNERTHTQRKRVTHKRGNQTQQKTWKKRKSRGRGGWLHQMPRERTHIVGFLCFNATESWPAVARADDKEKQRCSISSSTI